ncbi:MAG: hypothetical protein LBU64_04450 [Planctomycetota bacterium]|jgi:hypothetical protein|nr:hypothetical protein [Planctomycetota bacterium]
MSDIINSASSVNEIRIAWRRLASEERAAPSGLRGGLARKRTELLAEVTAWQLPDLLDALAEEAPNE